MRRHACAYGLLTFPLILAAQQTAPPGPALRTAAPPGISIRVVEGDGAINSIRLHRAHDPVVQVVDRNGAPVAGATVTFLLPASGPSGTFQGSGLSLTDQTDTDGRAVGHGLRPNTISGQYRIRVAASSHGQAASVSISQTNAEQAAKSKSTRTILILALIGAAAGGAAAVAGHGGSGSSSSAAIPAGATGGTSTGAVIVPGIPGFGPPH